jgi:hypothetical protein
VSKKSKTSALRTKTQKEFENNPVKFWASASANPKFETLSDKKKAILLCFLIALRHREHISYSYILDNHENPITPEDWLVENQQEITESYWENYRMFGWAGEHWQEFVYKWIGQSKPSPMPAMFRDRSEKQVAERLLNYWRSIHGKGRDEYPTK